MANKFEIIIYDKLKKGWHNQPISNPENIYTVNAFLKIDKKNDRELELSIINDIREHYCSYCIYNCQE